MGEKGHGPGNQESADFNAPHSLVCCFTLGRFLGLSDLSFHTCKMMCLDVLVCVFFLLLKDKLRHILKNFRVYLSKKLI